MLKLLFSFTFLALFAPAGVNANPLKMLSQGNPINDRTQYVLRIECSYAESFRTGQRVTFHEFLRRTDSSQQYFSPAVRAGLLGSGYARHAAHYVAVDASRQSALSSNRQAAEMLSNPPSGFREVFIGRVDGPNRSMSRNNCSERGILIHGHNDYYASALLATATTGSYATFAAAGLTLYTSITGALSDIIDLTGNDLPAAKEVDAAQSLLTAYSTFDDAFNGNQLLVDHLALTEGKNSITSGYSHVTITIEPVGASGDFSSFLVHPDTKFRAQAASLLAEAIEGTTLTAKPVTFSVLDLAFLGDLTKRTEIVNHCDLVNSRLNAAGFVEDVDRAYLLALHMSQKGAGYAQLVYCFAGVNLDGVMLRDGTFRHHVDEYIGGSALFSQRQFELVRDIVRRSNDDPFG